MPKRKRQAMQTEIDELELGERVADWLLVEELSAHYSTLEARAWYVVLRCYAQLARLLGPDNVPPEWRPAFDSHGMWHLP